MYYISLIGKIQADIKRTRKIIVDFLSKKLTEDLKALGYIILTPKLGVNNFQCSIYLVEFASMFFDCVNHTDKIRNFWTCLV